MNTQFPNRAFWSLRSLLGAPHRLLVGIAVLLCACYVANGLRAEFSKNVPEQAFYPPVRVTQFHIDRVAQTGLVQFHFVSADQILEVCPDQFATGCTNASDRYLYSTGEFSRTLYDIYIDDSTLGWGGCVSSNNCKHEVWHVYEVLFLGVSHTATRAHQGWVRGQVSDNHAAFYVGRQANPQAQSLRAL